MLRFHKDLIKVVAITSMLALGSLTFTSSAEAQVTAFKQAVAESASKDRELAAFYRENNFEAVWTEDSELGRARRSALFAAIDVTGMHGLPQARYDAEGLKQQLRSVRSTRDLGFAEVALSETFLKLARDMQTGALVPASIDDGIKREVPYRDRTELMAEFVDADPHRFVRSLAPDTNEYRRLLKEKFRLEQLFAAGGWGPTVPAKNLKPGQSGNAVVALRNRLINMGYLTRSATQVYDKNIEDAVRRFQSAHGLDADGVAGASTIVELNRSADHRLRSVIVALERERWLNRERGKRHVLVNLTDFSARIIDEDRITFETRAVVGKNVSDRRSPEFSDVMEHMIINPTWHVPRSIAVKEYLPQLQRNPGAAGHLRIVNARGQSVSRANVDFSQYNSRNFPFDLKQPPSSRNALGLVKFMFPNKYNIYLHDTPAKDLFHREKRAYSHGCIRLQQPFEFAYALLAKQESNPKDFFHSRLKTGAETKVVLETQVPVHIIYRTAFTNAKGQAQYREDVYGRDAKIWNALARAGVSLGGVQS